MAEQPKIIILDVGRAVNAFHHTVHPLLDGTGVIYLDLIDELWEGFYDQHALDTKLSDVIFDIVQRNDLRLDFRQQAVLSNALGNIAWAIAEQVNHHRLYPPSGFLPYTMLWTDNCLPYLKYSEDLDAVYTTTMGGCRVSFA